MFPFPSPEKLDFLIGLELSWVTLGAYTLHFAFDDGSSITMEHVVRYEDAGRVSTYNIQGELGPISFHPVIRGQSPVQSIEGHEYELTLIFADGKKLIFLSNDGPYEAGKITHKDQFVVF